MTKRVLFAAVLFSVITCMSLSGKPRYSFDGGSFQFSGSVSYARGFGAGYDDHRFELIPSIGWFFLPRLSLTLDLSIRYEDRSGVDYSSISGWTGFRYYFGDPAGTVFPFAGILFGFGQSSYSTVDASFYGGRLDAGVCFMLNRYVGLELSAAYRLEKVDNSGNPYQDGGVLRLYTGFSVYLF